MGNPNYAETFDYAGAKRAGYTDDEIAAHIRDMTEPRASEPYMERIDRGNNFTPWMKRLMAGAKEAEKAWGDSPIGFAPDSETTMFLQKWGVFGNPETGKPGMLLNSAEIGLKSIAGVADVMGRSLHAGAASVGGMLGQIAEDAGSSQGMANRLKRDVTTLGDVALMLSGLPEANLTRVAKSPAGFVKEDPVGGFPSKSDFIDAAKALNKGPLSPEVEAKLTKLYENNGYHPAEVWADAQHDPVLRQELLARGDDAPETLAGPRKPPPEEPPKGPGEPPEPPAGGAKPPAAGGGGEPPVPPSDQPPAAGGPEPGKGGKGGRTWEQAIDEVLKQVDVGGKEKGSPPLTADRLYEMLVDKLFPIKRAQAEAKALGLDLEVHDAPYENARLYAGWAGKAEVALKYDGPFNFHTYEKVGESLRTILAPVKDDLKNFRGFAVAVRAAELENKAGKETGVNMTAARQAVLEVPAAKAAQYKKTMQELTGFMNNVTAYYRDSGMLSRAGFEAMTKMNQFYLPFFRIFDEEGIGIAPVGQSLQARQVKQRITGSESKIIDPLESVIRNTFVMMAMSERNVVMTKLANMLRGADTMATELKRQPGTELTIGEAPRGPGRDVTLKTGDKIDPDKLQFFKKELEVREESVPEGATDIIDSFRAHGYEGEIPQSLEAMMAHVARPLAEDEIRVFEDGRPVAYKVDPDIARAVKNLDAETLGQFERMLGGLARGVRGGSVLTPDFWARHMFRDSIYAFSTYQHGTFTPMDMAKGFAGMVTGDADFVTWLKGGGGHVSLMALDRNVMQENLRHLTAETGLMYRAWNVVRHPLQPLQAGTEIALSSSHLGAFKKRLGELQAEQAKATGTALAQPKGTEVGVPGVSEPITRDAPRQGQIDIRDLPAELKDRELYIRNAEMMKDALRAYGYNVEDGAFTDIPVRDTKTKQQVISAAWTSRDTSIDNARIGSYMRAYNSISVFANAKVQDLTKGFVENAWQRPAKFTLYVGAGIVAPSAALWWWNRNDSRYQTLPQWQKDMFWIIPTDHWEPAKPNDLTTFEDGKVQSVRPYDQVRINRYGQLEVNNGAIIRMPKPFTLGVLFGSGTERLMESYFKDNPRAFKNFQHSLMESTVGDMLPSGAVPPLEQWTNRSRFTDQTLIPGPMEKLLPEYQYTPYTSELAKKLGHAVSEFPGVHALTIPENRGVFGGVAAALSSPMLIENYVRGFTGPLGNYAMHAVDVTARKAGFLEDPPRAAGTLADVPFVRAFVARYPTAQVSVIQNFYDEIGDIKKLHETWTARAKEGDVAAMDRIQEVGGDKVFLKFDDWKKTLQEHTQMINVINKDPSTPAAEKRQLIDSVYYAMHAIADEGVREIDQIKKELALEKKGLRR